MNAHADKRVCSHFCTGILFARARALSRSICAGVKYGISTTVLTLFGSCGNACEALLPAGAVPRGDTAAMLVVSWRMDLGLVGVTRVEGWDDATRRGILLSLIHI